MRTKLLLIACCIILTFILGCSSDSITDSKSAGTNSDQISKIPTGEFSGPTSTIGTNAGDLNGQIMFQDMESYQLARWLSGEMYAPDDLALKVKSELNKIRTMYGSSIPACNIEFVPPYEEGALLVAFTADGWAAYEAGNYHYWDNLNDTYKLISIEESNPVHHYVKLKFNGLPNVQLLADLYQGLPDLEYVEANSFCCDWPMLLAAQEDGRSFYFFRNAWGDCPAGCIDWEYYYFIVENSQVQFMGEYKNYLPYPRPTWVQIAESVKSTYLGF